MKYGWGYFVITMHTQFICRTLLYFRKVELNYMLRSIKNDGSKILDLGCNDGFFAHQIKKKNPLCDVYGADINTSALKYAKKRYPDVKFCRINNDFYNKKHKFDVIIVSHVLEHIHDREKFLKNISKIIKRKGKLLLAVPQERVRGDTTVLQWLYNMLRGTFENPHVVKLTYEDVKDLLENEDLKVTNKLYTTCFYPFKSKSKKLHTVGLVVIASKD